MRYAESQAKSHVDIAPRQPKQTFIQFLGFFTLIYVSLAAYMLFADGIAGFLLWMFLVVALVAAFLTRTVNYNRDLLLATEFQNAMFSNALGANFMFTMIARRDGSIIYTDRGVQEYFPKYSRLRHTTLNDFFELTGMSDEHRQAIEQSLLTTHRESILFSAVMHEGQQRDLVFTVDPINRPGDFLLLRVRRYSERRARATPAKMEYEIQQVRHYNEVLSRMIDDLPVCVFECDDSGILMQTNQHLEEVLGYMPGQMLADSMTLQDIMRDGQEFLADDIDDGAEVWLRHRTGQYVSYKVFTGRSEDHILAVAYQDHQMPVDRTEHILAALEQPAADQSTKYHGMDDAAQRSAPVPAPVPDPAPVAAPATRAAEPESAAENLPASAGPAQSVQSAAQSSPAIDPTVASIFEQSPIAIVRCRHDGAIVQANQAFDALVDSQANTRPDNLLDFAVDGQRETISQALGDLCAGKVDKPHIEIELARPDKEHIAVSVFAGVSTADELITFYLVDISEQKNLESRFAHSQKMQAVGQLAGGVAHDFNNLLTAMIGFCDLLLMRHPAGDQSFADIMQIKQNANRAANLVRQLLAFSRRQTLQAKNIDITEVLAELSNLIRRLIGENIELKMIHGRDLNMIKADQGQLEQVIINLAVNARDAMGDGGILTIRSSNALIDATHPLPTQMSAPAGDDGDIPAGEYVMIEVSDNGTGITDDVLAKIFEPFFSTKEIGSGTGLGLATVYGIIKQTGGYIFVASEEGAGTQFHIYFPALPAHEVEQAAVEVQEQQAQDLTGRETILLVEDETPVRAFAARALKNKGYTILEADCAEAALDLVHDHGSQVDLIVTDVIMPGMNGPSMVEKISSEYPDIKVIFMSGYAEDIFMNNYGSERSFNFLAKPFTLKQLASKVKEVLSA